MAGDTPKGFTGIVNMMGMRVPVLDGFANFKGKEYSVSQDGGVIMDDKHSVVGHIQDGEVVPPDPTRITAFMNGQPAKKQSPGGDIAQSMASDAISNALGQVSQVRDFSQDVIKSLIPASASAATGVPGVEDAANVLGAGAKDSLNLKDVIDTVGGVNMFKTTINNVKSQAKGAMVKALLGLPPI